MATSKKAGQENPVEEDESRDIGKNPKNHEIIRVNDIIGRCVNKGMEVEDMLQLVDFKDELQLKIERYQKAFKMLMKEYEIKESNGSYNWKDKEDAENITEKVNELLNTVTPLNKTKFMEKESALQFLEGLTLNEIAYCLKFLKR